MKAIIFLSSDDLIEQLACLGVSEPQSAVACLGCDNQEYLRAIYNQSMEEIKKYHTDYPYLERTKKFGSWMI